MKRYILIFILSLSVFTSSAQDGFHQHDGFYLAMATGPVFGSIHDNVGSETITFRGTAGMFDLKLGGAIKENIILHAAMISTTLSGPRVKVTGKSEEKAPNTLTIGEAMYGAGLTYYYLPFNCFAQGTFGIGNFTLIDSKNNLSYSTTRGFAMQLKVGKEWWVGKNWGLGVGISYGKTSLTDRPSSNVVEKLNSNRLGIVFNATFN